MGAFQQLFQHSSDAVFGTDQRGKIIYWNHACEKMLGWRTEDIYGAKCDQVLNGCDLLGKQFCSPDCPVRQKQAVKQVHGDFDLIINNKQNNSIWVNIGIYYVPPGSQDEAKGVNIFFSLRYIDCQRLLQRMVNETHNHNSRAQSLERFSLTTRETEILLLASQGMNSKQIAAQLHICPATVKNHFKNIYPKLKVHNRAEAITVAFQHDILPYPN